MQTPNIKNINLIRKIVWSFHKTTNIEWDDLYQEALLAYLETINSYKQSKGRLTTFIWHCISNHIKDYLRGVQPQRENTDYLEENGYDAPVEPMPLFERLSSEAQVIADFILSSPEIFQYLSHDQAVEKIKKHMSEIGLNEQQVKLGLRSLETAFQK